jgi:hypothetical protein
VAAVLGYDSSADDVSVVDYGHFTGDWQHAYGWYAAEDGQLASLERSMAREGMAEQSISLTGAVKTQQMGYDRYTDKMVLDWLTAEQTWSAGIAYATATLWPWVRNKGIECWWNEAIQGKRFRVYRDGAKFETTRAVERMVENSGTGPEATFNDSTKALTTSPWQRHKGGILWLPTPTYATHGGNATTWCKRYITSHTATVLTVPAFIMDFNDGDIGWLFDYTYSTYVLAVDKMKAFEPEEIPRLDRYKITIPMRKYVSA